MTPEKFCYWLNGFGELTTDAPTTEQWQSIKEHLASVFHKITPPVARSASPSLDDLNRAAMRRIQPSSGGVAKGPEPTFEGEWLC